MNDEQHLPGRSFLTAVWHSLAMLNYEIDPALLRPYVPAGTELDSWNGRYFVSLVGFLFQRTRVLGLLIPFHVNFEEVNLRFYVRRRGPEGWRRGVVFIKEIVPRWAIATVARLVYNENYVALPMRHLLYGATNSALGDGAVSQLSLSYQWRWQQAWHEIYVVTQGEAAYAVPDSEETFITEHYWGYAAQRNGGTVEYQVEHPSWRVWQVSHVRFTGDVAALYGAEFAASLSGEPSSAFVADGSAIVVRQGRRIS